MNKNVNKVEDFLDRSDRRRKKALKSVFGPAQDGVLNIHKPKGVTSFEVVAGVKKAARVKKVGHTGTLDPEASGVLIICLGQATKLVPFLMETTKEYRARLHLGVVTDTQDATGNVLQKTPKVELSKARIIEILSSFIGEIEQIPPMFSALRYQGKRLYELAREGIEVERKPRRVNIYRLVIQDYDFPYLTFDVCCSKGTYIRTLCADIGQKLGVGGHMSSLIRLRVGEMSLEQAVPFEEIGGGSIGEILNTRLYSMDQVMEFLPVVQIRPDAESKVFNGGSLSSQELLKCPDSFQRGDFFRGHNQHNHLLCIFEALIDRNGKGEATEPWFKPKRLLR